MWGCPTFNIHGNVGEWCRDASDLHGTITPMQMQQSSDYNLRFLRWWFLALHPVTADPRIAGSKRPLLRLHLRLSGLFPPGTA